MVFVINFCLTYITGLCDSCGFPHYRYTENGIVYFKLCLRNRPLAVPHTPQKECSEILLQNDQNFKIL